MSAGSIALTPYNCDGIDDETAVDVTNGTVEVVSEGRWKLLNPSPEVGGA